MSLGLTRTLGVLSQNILLVLFVLFAFVVIESDAQSGTTSNFKNIFLERCNTFQEKHQLGRNCTQLWTLFSKAFVNRTVCEVEASDYSEFLLKANSTAAIVDQAMFYTKVYPFVYNFTASQPGKYITIIDLLPGFVLDGLNWCWSQTSQDFNYTYCPSSWECPGGKNAYNSFWRATSADFTRLASGTVFAMVNGSVSSGAFTNNSQFYTVEVPAMEYPRIKELSVILVHNPQISFRESCSNATLQILNETLSAKGIKYTCEEDPQSVKQLQCLMRPEYQSSDYCATSGQWSLHHHNSSLPMLFQIGLIIVALLQMEILLT